MGYNGGKPIYKNRRKFQVGRVNLTRKPWEPHKQNQRILPKDLKVGYMETYS